MDTILETNAAVSRAEGTLPGAAVESVRQAYDGKRDRPDPAWVRGTCPQCGEELVSNCYYIGGRGYLITHECWSSLKDNPTCSYRKVI